MFELLNSRVTGNPHGSFWQAVFCQAYCRFKEKKVQNKISGTDMLCTLY